MRPWPMPPRSRTSEQGGWLGLSATFWHVVACIALILLAAATFSNALRNQFVSFDDWFLVEQNARIRSLGWHSLGRILFYQSNHAWLPLRELSYALDYHFWGLLPLGYHLTNLAFHTANVLLAYAVMAWLLRRQGLALLGAAWFAVHPVQVESVTWVSGRRDVQYAFFFLLAFLAFLAYERGRGRRRWVFYAASLVLLLAAMLSKASAMVFPAILVLTVLLFKGSEAALGRRLLACVAHGAIAAGLVVVHLIVAQRAGVVKGQALGSSLASVPLIFGKYWRLLFFPIHLVTPHGDATLKWSSPLPIALWAAAVAGVVALVWWSAPRRKVALFCLGWWFLLLLPVSNLIPLSVLVAERYMYLPVLAACAFGVDLVGGLLRQRKAVVVVCSASILALLAVATHSRNRVWENGRTFWEDGVSKWPDVPVTRIGLAVEYVEANELELAWREYMTVALAWGSAASRHPEHVELVNTGIESSYERLARRREASGDTEGALRVYETVIRLMPDAVKPRVLLAEAFERLGRLDSAREQVLAVKELDKSYPGLDAWLSRLEEERRPRGGGGAKE